MSPRNTGQPDPADEAVLRFAARVEQYLDDRLSPQEMAAFSDELAGSAAKRDLFRGMCVQHQMLRAQHRTSAHRFIDPTLGSHHEAAGNTGLLAELAEMEAHAGVDQPVDITDRVLASATPTHPRPRKPAEPRGPRVIVIPRPVAWIGIAAVLLLGVGLAYGIFSGKPAAPPASPPIVQRPTPQPAAPEAEVLARVTGSADAVVLDAGGRAVSGPLSFGAYRVESGLLGIEMVGGTTLVIEGPAAFRLDSKNAVGLITGRLAAEVPPQAWGFTVETPEARVVDIGTAFGVVAHALQGTEVHVFQGEVRAAARTGDGKVGQAVPLYADQAASVAQGQSLVSPIAFAGDQFERRVVKRLNLIDLIAGGDGTADPAPFGLNPATGGYIRQVAGTYEFKTSSNDGSARPVPGNAFVARVFIPDGGQPLRGLPEGLVFADLPDTRGDTFGVIWCGGPMPSVDAARFPSIPNHPAQAGAGFTAMQTMIMHANTAIVIDLDAIRAAHPGMKLSSVSLMVANTSERTERDDPLNHRSQCLVYVDQQRFWQHDFQRSDSGEQQVARLDESLPDTARYLTLVSADADGQIHRDWLSFGDPIFVLEPLP